jgi:hypothetical protein
VRPNFQNNMPSKHEALSSNITATKNFSRWDYYNFFNSAWDGTLGIALSIPPARYHDFNFFGSSRVWTQDLVLAPQVL